MKFKNIVITLTILFSMMNISCSEQNKIIPFSLSGNQEEIMKIDATGKVWANGEQVAILHANGLLTSPQNDTIAIRKADGSVYDADNNLVVKITDNGAIVYEEGKNLTWKTDGRLEVMQNEFLTIKPNNKGLYSNASLLFVIYASMGASSGTLPN